MVTSLIEITRGKIVESIHYGDVAVVDSEGKLLYYCGNPQKITYIRSAAKPLQTLNVILSGAHIAYNFLQEEIAIMCASHYAEPFHLLTVESILRKIGLNKDAVLCGKATSLSYNYALQLAYQRVAINQLYSDCSGKHAGMLAVCKYMNYTLPNYLSPEHPCQQDILKHLAYVCDYPAAKIAIGIDGCSAPVHALPLFNMALGYARFTNTGVLSKEYADACEIIFNAMNAAPQMVSGTDGFCTRLIASTKNTLIGKVGAEGIYCVGIKNKNIGIAIKIHDGSMKVLPPVVLQILDQLGFLDTDMKNELHNFIEMDNTNDIGTVVGKIKAVFELKKA